MFAKISLVKGTRSQAPQIIYNNTAWDFEKCRQRMNSNNLDGDARFIVGCYYLLQKEYDKAAERFTLTIPLRYKSFSENLLIEGLGCAYYELGKAAKRRQSVTEYITDIQQEQEAYTLRCQNGKNEDSLFCYLYALTYIDLASFITEQKEKGLQPDVRLPDFDKPVDTRTAYEKAAQILEAIPTPDSKVFDLRVFVYKRLGLDEKANETAKLQSESVRGELLSQQRAPVRQSIIKALKPQDVLTPTFKAQYMEVIRAKYTGNATQPNDQAAAIVKSVAASIVSTSTEAAALTAENKEILTQEISAEISQRIRNAVRSWEAEFIWKSINSLVFDKREYGLAQAKINEYRDLLQQQIDPKRIDSLEKEIKSRSALQQKLLAEQKASEQEAARQPAELPVQPSRNERPRVQQPPRPTQASRPSATQKTAEAPVATAPTEDPEQTRICAHIEDLIKQKDYVAAYRGISVYAEIFKKHYGEEYTTSLTKQLETAIFKKFGETYLRDLKKDLHR